MGIFSHSIKSFQTTQILGSFGFLTENLFSVFSLPKHLCCCCYLQLEYWPPNTISFSVTLTALHMYGMYYLEKQVLCEDNTVLVRIRKIYNDRNTCPKCCEPSQPYQLVCKPCISCIIIYCSTATATDILSSFNSIEVMHNTVLRICICVSDVC